MCSLAPDGRRPLCRAGFRGCRRSGAFTSLDSPRVPEVRNARPRRGQGWSLPRLGGAPPQAPPRDSGVLPPALGFPALGTCLSSSARGPLPVCSLPRLPVLVHLWVQISPYDEDTGRVGVEPPERPHFSSIPSRSGHFLRCRVSRPSQPFPRERQFNP